MHRLCVCSLDKYCRVGNFFVSILIPALQNRQSGYVLKPELMQQLLSALFQRAVIEDDPAWKLACMGAISTMYERYPEQFRELLIIPYYVYLLHPSRAEPIWRDHIIRFMQTVLREPVNAKRFLTFGGLTPLLHLVNLVHTLDSPDPPLPPQPDDDPMPELDRRQSLSLAAAAAVAAAAAPRLEGKASIDEEGGGDDDGLGDLSSDDETGPPPPRARGGKGELSYSPSPSPTQQSLLSSSDDEATGEAPMSPPAAPPAPGPPPPPPPPPQPQPQPTRNGGLAPGGRPPAAVTPPPSAGAGGAGNGAGGEGPGAGALPRAKSMTSPRSKAVGVKAKAAAASTLTSAPLTPSTPSTPNPPTPAESSKPVMVTQAGGVRMKSAAESKWDWSDERENLMSGLPPLFPVEEVSARCVRLLRIVAYGGARLRRQLTTPPLLQSLSALLLCPVAETREDGLRLYLDLLSTSPHVIPFLASTGLFPCVVYSTRHGFSPLLAKLIDRTHLRQSPDLVPEGQSALAQYLPSSLVSVLVSDGAEALRLAMDADVAQPDIIWNGTLRLFMHDALARLLAPYLQSLRRGGGADAPFPPDLLKQGVAYETLQDELCVGGVYLRPLNDIGETDLQAVHLREPGRFIVELQKALNSRKYVGDELGAVLLSTTIAVSRHGALDECRHFKAFPVLLALLDPEDRGSAAVVGRQPAELVLPLMAKAAQLLNALLILEGGDNARLCFEAKGLDRLGHCVQAAVGGDLSDESRLISVHHALASWAELVKRHPPALKQAEVDAGVLKALGWYLRGEVAGQFPQPTMGALGCLGVAVRSDRALETAMRQGAVLQAVRLAGWYGREGDEEEAVDEAEAEVNAQVRAAAVQMLAVVRERGNKRVQGVLAQLLTPEGVGLLGRGGAEWVAYWDGRVDGGFKGRLSGYLNEQLQAVAQQDGDDWREYSDGGALSFQ